MERPRVKAAAGPGSAPDQPGAPPRIAIENIAPVVVQDLLSDARFLWQGTRNYVHLDPAGVPAHLFRVRPRLRTERDFDYYL